MDFPANIPLSMRKHIEPILFGAYTMNHTWFSNFTESARNHFNQESASGDANTTCSSRVWFITKTFPYIKLDVILDHLKNKTCYPTLWKDQWMGNYLKSIGDNFVGKEQPLEALRCYALALNFYPKDAFFCLNLLYHDRSALLYALHDFESAGKDVEAALALRNPSVEQIMSQNSEPNSALPDFVKLRNIPHKGKGLIATKLLQKGTTIVTEDPYVHMTTNQLRWQTFACDRCLVVTRCPIPCENCVFFKYCSVACRTEDQLHGHRFECPILHFIHVMEIPDALHMSIKAICKGGPQILYKYFKIWLYSGVPEQPWTIDPASLHRNWDPYRLLLNLQIKDESSDKFLDAWYAVVLARVLRRNTTFFEQVCTFEVTRFEKFVAMIILRHLYSFGHNSTEIPDLEQVNGEPNVIPIGNGIYPRINMVNDSTTPNVHHQQLPRGQISLVTSVDVKGGKELFFGHAGTAMATTSASASNSQTDGDGGPSEEQRSTNNKRKQDQMTMGENEENDEPGCAKRPHWFWQLCDIV